jgi:hypothetical protein
MGFNCEPTNSVSGLQLGIRRGEDCWKPLFDGTEPSPLALIGNADDVSWVKRDAVMVCDPHDFAAPCHDHTRVSLAITEYDADKVRTVARFRKAANEISDCSGKLAAFAAGPVLKPRLIPDSRQRIECVEDAAVGLDIDICHQSHVARSPQHVVAKGGCPAPARRETKQIVAAANTHTHTRAY